MKSIIITLVCFMAGCASPSGQSDSCSPPARATYSVTATPLEYGCGGTRVSTATFEDGLVTSGERDEVELVDSCTTRALNGRDTFVVTFNEDWSFGEGRVTLGGCAFDVGLVRK